MANGELPQRPDRARWDDGIARGRLERASSIAGLTARVAGESVADRLRARLTGQEDPGRDARTAERYAELLGRSKGVLMKAGQMLSFLGTASSQDMRPVYQTALARLQSKAPPMPAELARSVLEHELGRGAEQAFAELDWTPLAAASIGQVHAGRLHDGRAVAVKIQYPGVADAIRADLKNVELLATLLSLVFSRLRFDLRAAASELGLRISEELDYRHEALNQAEFAGHYRGHPLIRIPAVVGELCSERVLTQQLVTGRDWSAAIEAPQGLRDEWGETLHRFTYGSFSRLGLVHADPHPGNYLFHEDGGVSFLDFGCVKRFSRAQLQACQATFRKAFVEEDVLGTWNAGIEAGFWHDTDGFAPEEAFRMWRGLRGYLLEEQPLTLTSAHVAGYAEHLSPDGPLAGAIRNVTSSPEYTVMPRIELGVLSLLAGLRSRNDWRAIADSEWFNVERRPLTSVGERHRAFAEERSAEDAR